MTDFQDEFDGCRNSHPSLNFKQSKANFTQHITVQQDSSDLPSETKRGLLLNIFINSNFHSWKARIHVAECNKAPF